jgi:hypothetical protein
VGRRPVALLLISYLALYTGLPRCWYAAVRRFGVAGIWFAPDLGHD